MGCKLLLGGGTMTVLFFIIPPPVLSALSCNNLIITPLLWPLRYNLHCPSGRGVIITHYDSKSHDSSQCYLYKARESESGVLK